MEFVQRSFTAPVNPVSEQFLYLSVWVIGVKVREEKKNISCSISWIPALLLVSAIKWWAATTLTSSMQRELFSFWEVLQSKIYISKAAGSLRGSKLLWLVFSQR